MPTQFQRPAQTQTLESIKPTRTQQYVRTCQTRPALEQATSLAHNNFCAPRRDFWSNKNSSWPKQFISHMTSQSQWPVRCAATRRRNSCPIPSEILGAPLSTFGWPELDSCASYYVKLTIVLLWLSGAKCRAAAGRKTNICAHNLHILCLAKLWGDCVSGESGRCVIRTCVICCCFFF